MRNHFHLVVETPRPNLVSRMKWLLGTYTQPSSMKHVISLALLVTFMHLQDSLAEGPTPHFLEAGACCRAANQLPGNSRPVQQSGGVVF